MLAPHLGDQLDGGGWVKRFSLQSAEGELVPVGLSGIVDVERAVAQLLDVDDIGGRSDIGYWRKRQQHEGASANRVFAVQRQYLDRDIGQFGEVDQVPELITHY